MAERVISQKLYFEQVGYVPHPKQLLYHQSRARFRIPTCGRRFGKSMMAGTDLEVKMFIPDRRYWICGPTYDLGEKEFRVMWMHLIVDKALGRDKRIKKAYNKRSGEMFIEMPWHTRVEVRSADHPESLVGESLDHVIMSEAAKHKRETFEKYIRPALADRRGSADFPTTPEGFNWLYDIWSLGQDPSFPEYESWRFPSWENPYVYPGGRQDPEILLIERTTSPEWFLQEIGADFASFVGKIYAEFDELTHVRPCPFVPGRKNYICFDWGYTNPFAAIELQVDAEDNIYIWREHYMSFKRLSEHFEIMRNRKQPKGYHIECGFGDAADPEATMTVNVEFCPCISLPEAKTNWRQGVECVRRFVKLQQTGEQDEYGTPKLAPKLFVDPSCRNTIWEFLNYRTPEPKNDEPYRERAGSSTAPTNKQADHAVDAVRYGLMHLFELGAQRHLTETEGMSYVDASVSGGGGGIFVMGRGPGRF